MRSARENRKVLFCLLAVIFCAHLLVACLSHRSVVRDDAESYVLLGRSLAAGRGYVFEAGQTPTAWRAPGYPVFLATIFRLTGGGLQAARLAHALLWTLTALLTYRIGRCLYRISSEDEQREQGTALLAAGLVGLYPEFLGMTGLLWSENLFVFLFLAAIERLLALSAQSNILPPAALETRRHGEKQDGGGGKEKSRRQGADSLDNPGTRAIENRKSKIENHFALCCLTGVLMGLAILTRSTALILIPVIWFVLLRRGRSGRAIGQAALVTGVALLVLAGWTLRNRQILGRAILVESNTGYNLYVGNRPDTPIPFAWRRMDSIPHDPIYQQLTAGHSEGEAYAILSHAAWTEIKANPLHTLLLAFGKTFDFWLPDFFIAFNLRAGTFGPRTAFLWPMVLAGTVSGYLIFWSAALRQAFQTRHQWETRFLLLLPALYTLPHALVFGASRHHLPLLPFLILLAAPCLYNLFHARKERLSTDFTDYAD